MKKLITILAFLFPAFLFGQSSDGVEKEVDSLLKVADQLMRQRNFDSALEVIQTAEDRALETFSDQHLSYAKCLEYKGRNFYFRNDYDKSEHWYLRALAVLESGAVENELVLFSNLHNLAALYKRAGRFEEAELYFLKALPLIKPKTEEATDQRRYAIVINNLASLYTTMGKFEEAESLYNEVMLIRKNLLGENHLEYSYSLNGLGLLYWEMGRYQEAESLFLRTKRIQEQKVGPDHIMLGIVINNLAGLYLVMKEYDSAEAYLKKALQLRESNLDKNHPDIAHNLIGLGILYTNTQRYEEAESLFLKAKEIQEKTLGPSHQNYVNNLNNIGRLYFLQEKYGEAEALCLEALEKMESIFGKNHQDYAITARLISKIYWKTGHYQKAETYLKKSTDIQLANLRASRFYLSQSELMKYSHLLFQNFDQIYSFSQHRNAMLETAYDNALHRKGFLLNAINQISLHAGKDSESSEILAELKSYYRRLAAEYSKPIALRNKVSELEKQVNQLEKELAQKVAGFNDVTRQVNWKQVQQQLGRNESAIEFVTYNYLRPDATDTVMYAALLLRPGEKAPHFIPLFDEEELKELLEDQPNHKRAYLNRLYSGGDQVSGKGHSLYQLIWKPLVKRLGASRTIYLSPTGLLHRINLGAIMKAEGLSVADQYQIVNLGSTRQLVVRQSASPPSELTAVVYGGIYYDLDTSFLATLVEQPKAAPATNDLPFSSLDRSAPERGSTWDYLKGSEREASEISAIIAGKQGRVKTLKGYEATEESVKQLGQSQAAPRILHLATHGYFMPDPPESEKDAAYFAKTPAFKISDHPMIRSGLIMAGGNHVWRGKPAIPKREDGILTAYEVSQADLRSTELVVLSACETGLGDIEGNEGVYGLQRAFKMAGVDKLIMSLWTVPDEHTQEMMVLFYDHWLNKGLSLREAFRSAQQAMRNNHPDHYFWAAFVLIE